MNFELTASMMCADYGNLEREVKNLAEGGIDSFHIDIMDGRYVPNFAMSLNDMRYIASVSPKPLDVHLMIEHPNNRIDLFLNNLRQGDTVYIHPEAEYHPSTTLQSIINAGMVPGIAINPGTSVETVMEMLRIVKKVLVMSVNPGNAGQMFLPYVGKKITKLLSMRKIWTLSSTGTGPAARIRFLNSRRRESKDSCLERRCYSGKRGRMGRRCRRSGNCSFDNLVRSRNGRRYLPGF